MSEYTPLKYGYDRDYVGRLASSLHQAWAPLDESKFQSEVFTKDWKDLELKGRLLRIADVMDRLLPVDFADALKIVDQVVDQFDSYLAMFIPAFVEVRGMRSPAQEWTLSLSALARYTPFSSSEFAVRPFIVHDQESMLQQMLVWTKDPNEHVRRLASEGCRPRLPWAMALPTLKKDPGPIIPILESLRSDDSEYVRRSVANNLNDISKDHPVLVYDLAKTWLAEAPQNTDRERLVKHACRTMLKAGDPNVLQLFGFRDPQAIKVEQLKLDHDSLRIGEKLEFKFRVSGEPSLGKLRVEYMVYYQKKNGQQRGKIFQLSEFESQDSTRPFSRKHAFKNLSTRIHHPGIHAISVVVNGVEKARAEFDLKA